MPGAYADALTLKQVRFILACFFDYVKSTIGFQSINAPINGTTR